MSPTSDRSRGEVGTDRRRRAESVDGGSSDEEPGYCDTHTYAPTNISLGILTSIYFVPSYKFALEISFSLT